MPEPEDPTSPRRRRRRKKKKRNLFDISGVKRIVLSELSQKIIGCVVGEHVTSESPWKSIQKEAVQDNLELHEESSEFLPLRKEILAYPRPTLLIGYIADETRDNEDEFYICVTEEANDAVQKIIEKLKQEQEERLYNQLYKDSNPWQTLGSETEVDESIIRNTRPLLEVEVETQYPIFPGKVQFRLVSAEKRRDGYMELKCNPEENLTNVYMRRIDCGIQVAPALISTEAQTVCTYPKNAGTEYLYDAGVTEAMVHQCEPKIIRYANNHIEDLSDLLKVNGTIDFYANDFDSLVKNAETAKSTTQSYTNSKELIEYLSFMDVNLCKGKMISDLQWHRMWSGTIAIAYCDASPNIFYNGLNKDDAVYKAVHTVNLVLIWSFSDALKPKLILESPREVLRISFCKFDENILIGGCKNGQIIIWDIRNKLQRVEEKDVLTTSQQKYRQYMHSLMGWMKNTHDIAIVRPTAVSDLAYSHKGPVTGISWVSPYYQFSRTGNLSEVELDYEGNIKYSMQLITSGMDGKLLIWDLKDKPTAQPGGYKPRKLRRLKKRPSALQAETSPYRALHLILKPRYKISVTKKDNKTPLSICRINTSYCHLKYEEVNPVQNRKYDMKERVIHTPIMEKEKEIEPKIKIGSAEGDYAWLYWEGQDFDSGEVVNCEQAKYIYDAKWHDGPITNIHTSPLTNMTLTVGGKIFALWRDDFPAKPIVWRRSRQFFTKGELNIFKPYRIITHSVSGKLARWILPIRSKTAMTEQVISNSFLTASALHPYDWDTMIYGIGDELGAFRLFYVKTISYGAMNVIKAMSTFIDREVNRKKLFLKWQEDYNKRNEIYLARKKEEDDQKAKEEALKEEKKEEPKAAEIVVRKGPLPGKYVEWIIEQRQITEQARIKGMIINKKQLDTKELEKRRKPLQKLDEENERKKRKQKERLKQGETIFQNTVSSLFPDVFKEKPAPPPDPYAGGDPKEEKESCFSNYTEMATQMDNFIKSHPLQYDFSFKNLLVASKTKYGDPFSAHNHSKRYSEEKRIKRAESVFSEANVSNFAGLTANEEEELELELEEESPNDFE